MEKLNLMQQRAIAETQREVSNNHKLVELVDYSLKNNDIQRLYRLSEVFKKIADTNQEIEDLKLQLIPS